MKSQIIKRTTVNRTGFTLIELLVTVAIISLLMAILFPALSKVKNSARKLRCASQMQQIGLAVFAYADNNEQNIIRAGEMMYSHTPEEAMSFWFVKLLPYVGAKADQSDIFKNTTKIWICPSDKDAYPRGFLNCPHSPLTSYAPNGYYPQRNAEDIENKALKLGPAGGYKLFQINSASSCMLMGETSYASQFYDADAPSIASYNLPRDGHHRCTSGFYHDGFMNVLFADGHLEALRGEHTNKPEWPPRCEKPHQSERYMYFPNLKLPDASEKPQFWGPGY